MSLHSLIEQHWQQPKWWLSLWLKPLSQVFKIMVELRLCLYRCGVLKSHKLPIPVLVVGNIHSGGTGKTPITASIVLALKQKGIRVGIVSRGYGRQEKGIHLLNSESTAQQAGDEPLMLYRQTGVPIAVGSKRIAAAQTLLSAHPQLQLIIADDGLQHYALARDLEIAVYPAADAQKRPQILPHGSLREPIDRLNQCDVLIVSNGQTGLAKKIAKNLDLSEKMALFDAHLDVATPYRLHCSDEKLMHPSSLQNKKCVALAAIARPERFFQTLNFLNIPISEHRIFPDHYPLKTQDLPDADEIFITEKDAVKFHGKLPENVWVVPVYAIIEPNLANHILNFLNLELLHEN